MSKKIQQKKEYEARKALIQWVEDVQERVDKGEKVPFQEKQRWFITRKKLKKEEK
jgi:hypothetical protein